MVFPRQNQFFLLRKLLQPFGQEVVNALKETGETEVFFKIVEQISRSEFPFFRS